MAADQPELLVSTKAERSEVVAMLPTGVRDLKDLQENTITADEGADDVGKAGERNSVVPTLHLNPNGDGVQKEEEDMERRELNGEERAQRVWEICQGYKDRQERLPHCTYEVLRAVRRRLLPVFKHKMLYCSVGKTGTSNWKTTILQLNDVISDEEASVMEYPHHEYLWWGNRTLFGFGPGQVK
eukprot:sb/3471482/